MTANMIAPCAMSSTETARKGCAGAGWGGERPRHGSPPRWRQASIRRRVGSRDIGMTVVDYTLDGIDKKGENLAIFYRKFRYMSRAPVITLGQWQALVAVVETGGYAQAAEHLHKSQSSVTYAVQKLEAVLDVKVFRVQGRKAILTPTGQMLYRRASVLLGEAQDLERAAHTLSAGWEAEITCAVEVLFPTWLLLRCLKQFGNEAPHARVEVMESVLNGATEALIERKVELAITHEVPPGFLGDPLMWVRIVPVAAPDHPLHRLDRELGYSDLRAHRLIVLRGSGVKQDRLTVSIKAERCWVVRNMETAIQAVLRGHGFGWLPEQQISTELESGALKRLPLREGRMFVVPLYLILASPDGSGPGVRRLAEIIREATSTGLPGGAIEDFMEYPGV